MVKNGRGQAQVMDLKQKQNTNQTGGKHLSKEVQLYHKTVENPHR